MSERITNFARILEGMPQPYLVLDSELTIVGASDTYLSLTSRSRADLVGRHILEAFPENPDAAGTVEQGPLEVSLRHVLKTGKPHEMAVIQYDIPVPGGGFAQKFWTPIHTPVAGEDGRIAYIIQNPMDVTESVLKAREADARLRVALHAADLASFEFEPETDIWRRSHSVEVMFGFRPGEGGPVAAPFFARMHPDDLPRVMDVFDDAARSPDKTVVTLNFRILPSAGGDMKYVAARGEVLRTSTGKVRMIGVLMDMTADRAREAELAAAVEAQGLLLKQRELLLAEVNHRVKNSLQLVVSTLRLQARRLEDPATSEAFERAISRVRAIVSVHERLYRTDNALTVDIGDHLRRLCLDLAGAQAADVVVDVDAMELPTETAIPISVIVNELLASSLTGSPGNGVPTIVSLRELPDGKIELAVQGPSRVMKAPEPGLRRRLVKSMVAQIGGSFTEEETAQGNRAIVLFEKELLA